MKIKQKPEDFIVRELADLKLNSEGRFAYYRLVKRGLGTLEVVQNVARQFGLSRRKISFGGLKDKYSHSEQIISVEGGPDKNIEDSHFILNYLGKSTLPMSPACLAGNHFTLCIRDVSDSEVEKIYKRLEEIKEFGVPNYFDDQRFGSLRGTDGFIAKKLILGDFEGALKFAIASPSGEDRAKVRQIKETISKLWGNWKECAAELPKSSERSIVCFLRDHPKHFAGAFERLEKNLRVLYLSAYQSYLWNRCAELFLKCRIDAQDQILYKYTAGTFLFYQKLPQVTVQSLQNISMPLLKNNTQPDAELTPIVEQVLQEEGIALKQMRIKKTRMVFFSKGERKLLLFPQNLKVEGAKADELNDGRRKVTLSFELSKGSYATILVKRLTYDFV
ncbi:tRNA pseudouridine(13) synthase TruD [Candidatus Peregrinibacteria bacterium]|nr:tRNA pseudouridine(13) synthase TruD [Candidatus Peregrinibacteria bacterium]